VDKRSCEPAGLRTEGGMRESKETKFSVRNVDAVEKDILETVVVDFEIRNLGIKSNRHAIFVAELDPEEVVMIFSIFSKDSIGGFGLGPIEKYCEVHDVNNQLWKLIDEFRAGIVVIAGERKTENRGCEKSTGQEFRLQQERKQ
jgi:hypothetical protein